MYGYFFMAVVFKTAFLNSR